MKEKFRMPFNHDTGLYFNGYLPFEYDTGETVVVKDIDENGELFDKEVPLIKGGWSICENVEADVHDQILSVEVETSEEKINLLKQDSNYEWVSDESD